MESSQTEECKTGSFKKRKQRGMSRKRKEESSESEGEGSSAVVKVKRRGHSNLLKKSTGVARNSFDQHQTVEKNGREKETIGREPDDKKLTGGEDDSKKSKISVTYESSRTGKREGPDDMGATSIIEIDTEFDRDSQAIFEKHLKANKDSVGVEDDKIYKGQSSYTRYYEKKDTAQGNAASGMVR